jgi:glyoxylase-like metal-dependent hydrolase (beta-lactamase superfamily II)
MAIPLEDGFADIIGKAQRGCKVSESQLASLSGVEPEKIHSLLAGKFDEAAARKVAPILGLHPGALVDAGKQSWRPRAVPEMDGLACFNTPFGDMTVNSYLVWDPAEKVAAAFDTGADVSQMLDVIREEGLTLRLILLTHTHGDHVFDLDRLREKTGAVAHVSRRERMEGATAFDEGARFSLGALSIETRLTSGHSAGGITYVIAGLERPLAVVGDALFAGSMGGGMVSYADALAKNRENILTLPDETVLCPGHGPPTTVAEEKMHNPFFKVS